MNHTVVSYDVSPGHVSAIGAQSAAADTNALFIRTMLRLRSARHTSSLSTLFEWPCWDMLLDLAATHLEGGHVSVSSLCLSTGAPQSTALRKLATLEEYGLIRRYVDRTDRRRIHLALTEHARRIVHVALTEDIALGVLIKPCCTATPSP